MSKKKLIGYTVKDAKGNIIEVLTGTQPRRLLNKHRKVHIVRKNYASSRGVAIA